MIRKGPLSSDPTMAAKTLDLGQLARFEVSSEDVAFPLEGMLGDGPGWRAAVEGPQTIRLTFDSPQKVSRVTLVFEERAVARTQEFVLSYQDASDDGWRELRRQQFNFSPPGTCSEREEIRVSAEAVGGLELRIIPSIGGGGVASLKEWRVE